MIGTLLLAWPVVAWVAALVIARFIRRGQGPRQD